MKKVLIVLTALIAFCTTGISQAVTTPGKKTDNKIKVVFPAKPTTSAKVVQMPKILSKTPDPQKAKTVEPTTSVVLKKDGEPDNRYKNIHFNNGPVKKDGTPDMRYKLNKKGK